MKDHGDAPFDNDPHPSALSKPTPQRTGEWTWLNDDYRAGTVFITDDPTGEQGAIAEGLRETVARRIVKAHNAAIEARIAPAETLGRERQRIAIELNHSDRSDNPGYITVPIERVRAILSPRTEEPER